MTEVLKSFTQLIDTPPPEAFLNRFQRKFDEKILRLKRSPRTLFWSFCTLLTSTPCVC